MAVLNDFPAVAQALIERGASKTAQDIYDFKPIDYINPGRASAAKFAQLLSLDDNKAGNESASDAKVSKSAS